MKRRRTWVPVAAAIAAGLAGCGSGAHSLTGASHHPASTTTAASPPAPSTTATAATTGTAPASPTTQGTPHRAGHSAAPKVRRVIGGRQPAPTATPAGRQVARRCPPATTVAAILGRRVNAIAGAAGGELGCQYLPVGVQTVATSPLWVQFADLNNQTGSESPQRQGPTKPSAIRHADEQSCAAFRARGTSIDCHVDSTPSLGPGTFSFYFAARSPAGTKVAQCQEVIRDLIGAPLAVAVSERRRNGAEGVASAAKLCGWAARLAAAVM
jgi:hypothetical protein